VKVRLSVLIVGILALVFIFALLAQMIHHELTGQIFMVDVRDMEGFLGRWIILAYLLDVAFVVLVARFVVRMRGNRNE